MIKNKDITGQRFDRLTALYKLHNTKNKVKWLCVCDCGNFTETNIYNLNNGHTRSCGCYCKDRTGDTHRDHGLTNSRLFHIWNSMKQRCYNSNNRKYENYGGRGIKVCDEWLNDFMTFYDWAIHNGYDENLTIDRINVNGNYEPTNCRWADWKTQQRNRTNTPYYTINNETKSLSEWCEICNIKYHTVYNRLHRSNWTIERALELEE